MGIFFIKKKAIKDIVSLRDFTFHLYEIPFFILLAYLLFISVWKCFYYPNIPFDTMVGSDMVAKAAVMEGTLDNSIFNDFLPQISTLSNQPYYAPFTMLMQVIFLALGGLFGKVWLSVLVIAFWLFLYFELRHYIHPILAGILIIIAFYSPEMFAYTYLVQTDYANAIFFVAGVSMFNRYLKEEGKGYFWAAAILFGLATWTRTETVFFLPLITVLIALKDGIKKAIFQSVLFGLFSVVLVLLWNYLFLGGMVPKAIELGVFQF